WILHLETGRETESACPTRTRRGVRFLGGGEGAGLNSLKSGESAALVAAQWRPARLLRQRAGLGCRPLVRARSLFCARFWTAARGQPEEVRPLRARAARAGGEAARGAERCGRARTPAHDRGRRGAGRRTRAGQEWTRSCACDPRTTRPGRHGSRARLRQRSVRA